MTRASVRKYKNAGAKRKLQFTSNWSSNTIIVNINNNTNNNNDGNYFMIKWQFAFY